MDAIRAGSIGACYLAALIHQSLRNTIRKNGLPRPLCVLAACDGVYPFFDAPVAGLDEIALEEPAEAEPGEVWPNELENAASAPSGEPEEDLPAEASLLSIGPRREGKKAVIVLGAEDAREAAQFAEMAGAQRMVVEDDLALKGLLHGQPAADLSDADLFADWDEPDEGWDGTAAPDRAAGTAGLDSFPEVSGNHGFWSGSDPSADDIYQIGEFPEIPEMLADQPDDPAAQVAEPEEVPFVPPTRHSLRSQFNLAQAESAESDRNRFAGILDWFRRLLQRR